MNLSSFLTKDYENKRDWTLGENKPNSKPIKANTKPIKANKMPKQTQTKPTCRGVASGEAGSNPISKAKNAAAFDN